MGNEITLLHSCSSIGLAGVVFSMAVAIGVMSAHAEQVQPIEISRGTLVAVVPYSTGAMVAADSRETISGLYCDQRLKIRTPDGIENLVVAVTGSSRFYDLSALVGKGRVIAQPDLCSFVTSAPHLFDMESIVLDWLRAEGAKSAKDVSIDRLAAHCVERFASFMAVYPQLAPPPAPNGLMNVILVSYDPKSRETLVRDFRINQSAAGAVFFSDTAVYQYGPSTPSAFRLFGEADKFAQFVWPTFRSSQRLRADTRSLLSKQVLTLDVSSLQAEAFAVDLIDHGADNPNLNTSEEGVGRPVRLMRIDATGRPEMLR